MNVCVDKCRYKQYIICGIYSSIADIGRRSLTILAVCCKLYSHPLSDRSKLLISAEKTKKNVNQEH